MNSDDTRLKATCFRCKSYSACNRTALRVSPIIKWLVDDWWVPTSNLKVI